ncbi:MAG: hypothetical protein WC332_02165 [Clostridia bacterium]|jgi:hypothetical protein
MIEQPVKEPKLAPKTIQAMQYVDAGLTPRQALQAVNLKSNISNQAISKFNAKYKKYSLTTPKMQKLASKALQDCLSDKPINGEILPSYTNKIAAASMVYDRIEPVIRQNLNINVDVHPVDLSRWSNRISVDNSQIIAVDK